MAADNLFESPMQKAGAFVLVIVNILCARELAPGWGMHLGLSHAALYGIAMAGGAVGGAMLAGRYFLAGIVGGAAGSAGALMSNAAYLSAVSVSHSAIMAVVGLAGALPGILLGLGLGAMQKRIRSHS